MSSAHDQQGSSVPSTMYCFRALADDRNLTVAIHLGYSRQAFDHGFSGCRNKERCP